MDHPLEPHRQLAIGRRRAGGERLEEAARKLGHTGLGGRGRAGAYGEASAPVQCERQPGYAVARRPELRNIVGLTRIIVGHLRIIVGLFARHRRGVMGGS